MRTPTKTKNTLAVLACCLALGLSTTSCGGGPGGGNPELVLLGFNLPEVADVALNEALIFTFSTDVDPESITPDTLRVRGQIIPELNPNALGVEWNPELTVVDGNLVALIPRCPSFDDLSDVGLEWDSIYTVELPVFPAFRTITSIEGRPLLQLSETDVPYVNSFRTVRQSRVTGSSGGAFVETYRPLVRGLNPLEGGNSDDLGCLQNRNNSLYVPPDPNYPDAVGQQGGSPAPRLLCRENIGSPRVVPELCSPRHDQRAVGLPAAGSQFVGRVDLPPLLISLNEQVDPRTVTPYTPSDKLSKNIQLWRVGLLDGTPLTPPEQIQVNKPVLVQTASSVQMYLVATQPVLQGIYMVNVLNSVKDFVGNRLRTDDDPSIAGSVYQAFSGALAAARVPEGWRLFFQTLKLAGSASALSETFGSNAGEYGDKDSGTSEPGVFTITSGTDLLAPMPGVVPPGATEPSFRLLFGSNPGVALQVGQSTTANWNNGYRFLNLASLEVNTDADSGLGRLKAVYKPYSGIGGDGTVDTDLAPFTAGGGDVLSLTTTPGSGASINGDGIYEYERFHLRAGDTLTASGTQPLLILCRGDFIVDGTIDLRGTDGRFGLDTDGSTDFTNAGSIQAWGSGGTAGPGGGAGGRGGGPNLQPSPNGGVLSGGDGARASSMLAQEALGAGLAGTNIQGSGGGGAGHSFDGGAGTLPDGSSVSNAGAAFGNSLLEVPLSAFQPDRGYQPNAGLTGGPGGGGGSAADSGNGVPSNGDDCGGGGGGGGGAIWVIARGQITIGASGQILADGGDGGSTYGAPDIRIQNGVNPETGDPDPAFDLVLGLQPAATPSGVGGPGGGGAGGGVCLVGEQGVTVQAGAFISAMGGAGGSNGVVDGGGNPVMFGGSGADGRVLLMDMGLGPTVSSVGASIQPAASIGVWSPTVDLASVGVSTWQNLFVPTVDWAPVVGGIPQVPFFTDNFDFLTNTAGLARGPSLDFDAVFDYQGADDVTPVPVLGGDPASVAVGATPWSSDINTIDGKQWFRWRCRFFVRQGYPASGPSAVPLPAVLDLVIPFVK